MAEAAPASRVPRSQGSAPLPGHTQPCSRMPLGPAGGADQDVSYAAKPLWASYLALLVDPPVDGSFQLEENSMGPRALLFL